MSNAGNTSLDALVARALEAWRPPPRLSLSEWADQHFVLSPETAAEPGRWHTLPYQREIMDAMTDPEVTHVTVMKSARVGFTLMVSAEIAFHIAHEPAAMMVVQPTVDDAKGFSKETIAPMLRDVPALTRIVFSDLEDRKGPKDSSATLTHKSFPGGILSLVGANSGTGFRRVSRRIVIFDEVDAYPASAGSEGDPISLGTKRAESFWNRKIIAGSTPLVAGASRIEEMFEAGDQRRYYVPCPHCGHMDFLTFREGERGHFMRWPDDHPEQAFFVCRRAGCVIEHKDKRSMVERGEWRADVPRSGAHRSYHIWTAYSFSPNATWAHIAAEFLAAKRGGPDKLRTFVNTTLGETWQERGEAPDWEKLYLRRELYPVGSLPSPVRVVTAGVDVQKDRFIGEIVGWAENKESWSLDIFVIHGDTAQAETWAKLDEVLLRTFRGADGRELPIQRLAIDSGYMTQAVYNWARRYPMTRVIATKGQASARALVGVPSPVDVSVGGRRLSRGYRVWIIGVGIAKTELYGWLRLPRPDGAMPLGGFCHFPEHPEEFFRQLTAEHLVTVRKRGGYSVLEWQILPNRENHWLDCRVLARAAVSSLGLDRMTPAEPAPAAPHATAAAGAPSKPVEEGARPVLPPALPRPVEGGAARPAWLSKERPRGGTRPGGGWLGRRR